jgi:spore coat protein CotH
MFLSNRIHPAWCFFVTLVGISLATFGRGTTAMSQPTNPIQRSPTHTDFYQSDEVHSVYLQVTDENMQRMVAALPERISVPASFRWREISIDNVAIRFKGNSSANPSQQHKRSFLIKFDEYESDVRFLGLRRVSFDNGVQFGSLFSEPIITEILQDLGIKTHRCNYAKLYLNDKHQGV